MWRALVFEQRLAGPEVKRDAKCAVVQLARWFPDKWEVGPRQDMLVTPEETVNQVRDRLHAMTVSPVVVELLCLGGGGRR